MAEAMAAVEAGADRLELCSALEVGGLTPSAALVEAVLAQVKVPVMVMIRPRVGGFCYAADEFQVALADAEWALQQGAQGIVFGFLTRDGAIDAQRTKGMITRVAGRQTVFHRAFDFVRDPLTAAEELAEIGVTRLLTSGSQPTALAGATVIREIAERTRGRLEVMPGGGIRRENVLAVLAQTRCGQVHLGPATAECDGSLSGNSQLELVSPACLVGGASRRIDGAAIREVVQLVKRSQIPEPSP
jgi:copper homeostasis protein